VLGEEIGWILFAEYLAQVQTARPHSLLDPQGVRVQVAQFA
jgi:hypothetical protein